VTAVTLSREMHTKHLMARFIVTEPMYCL
jgi:hypothetical protein